MKHQAAAIAIGLGATLALTGPAWASGTNSGGVNSGGVNTGGGGGGTTAAPATPCAQIQGWSAPAGQTPGDRASGAVWSSWTVKNCSTGTGRYNQQISYTNLITGDVTGGPACALTTVAAYGQTIPMSSGQGISCKLDNDFLPLATSFTVSVNVYDTTTGAVLATQSSTVSTPAAQGL
jgi:hypothetical protein